MFPKIALASKSPRRREILEALGWDHTIVEADVDESPIVGENPSDMARRLAAAKSIAGSRRSGGLITIGADTVVDVDGAAFGKPIDRDDAKRMLRALSGRAHFVHTGIAASRDGSLIADEVVTTEVYFADLSIDDIENFIATGMADDKAGAYAAQRCGAVLIERIDGCFYNVVGLPVYRLTKMLKGIFERS